jgi:hypothetical protein
MMNTKTAQHTPGPWESTQDVGDTFVVYPVYGIDDFKVICRGIKSKADADAIVALPDLIRELRGAVQALESHGFTQPAGTARAAIAKAEGRAS